MISITLAVFISWMANLPLLHLLLLPLVLLNQILQHLAQTLRVRLECWHYVLNSTLDEHAINHAEAFAVAGKRSQGFEDEPGRLLAG